MHIQNLLQKAFAQALADLTQSAAQHATLLKPTQDPKHGDYQANCAMPLAKELGKKPQDVAREVVSRLGEQPLFEAPTIAGPGFINLRLRDAWLAKHVQSMGGDDRLGITPVASPSTIIVDFSSPNVAKPMHVGHLRSTVIGDCLARLHRFLGHHVVTDNHLGDWGTQFGILLYGYKHFRDEEALKADPVREMARIYIHVRELMKGDEDAVGQNPVAQAAREETAKLHAGDPENTALWRTFMPWCLEEINQIYRRLGVAFDHCLGESFYNPMLPGVVESLLAKGIAQESEGAIAIFYGEEEPPALIRKKDGAFTYTTTDLATIKHRRDTWKPRTVLYVVDARQALHFKNLFDAATRWGVCDTDLVHVPFGSVLGADRRPIKTREGGAVELGALLQEAVDRARAVYDAGRPDSTLGEEHRKQVAEVVGLGAVKYADLSQNRVSDYVFSWDKMLAMDGNTATYMQYAYARIRSIIRKGGVDLATLRANPPEVILENPHERALAVQLSRFEEALVAAAAEHKPNVVTSYLWDLAKAYSGFYQNCPVHDAAAEALRQSRYLLCDLTGRTIQRALDLLGIQTVEQM